MRIKPPANYSQLCSFFGIQRHSPSKALIAIKPAIHSLALTAQQNRSFKHHDIRWIEREVLKIRREMLLLAYIREMEMGKGSLKDIKLNLQKLQEKGSKLQDYMEELRFRKEAPEIDVGLDLRKELLIYCQEVQAARDASRLSREAAVDTVSAMITCSACIAAWIVLWISS